MRIEQDAKLDYKDVLIRSKRSIQRKQFVQFYGMSSETAKHKTLWRIKRIPKQ